MKRLDVTVIQSSEYQRDVDVHEKKRWREGEEESRERLCGRCSLYPRWVKPEQHN